jgi:hypothetical protein
VADDYEIPGGLPEGFDPEKPEEALQAERDPNNAANEYAIAEKRRKKKDADSKEANGIKYILANEDARRWLAYLLVDTCSLFQPIQNQAHDSNALHWREGARQVGLSIHEQCLAADPAGYMKLLSEKLVPPLPANKPEKK